MKKIKPNEIITVIISTIITAVIAIGVVKFYAPSLLGISSDIQMVKTSKKVPPFFDVVFRKSDHEAKEYIIPDPIIKRAKPFLSDFITMGPNDLLGFRNRNVPNAADIIMIGDSQTYGVNATLENNWPNLFISRLKENNPYITHYNLAVGGWGAIEYLEIFYKSLAFQPRMVIVAYYTGNDPLDTFRMAYSNKRWSEYRADVSMSSSDIPEVEYPPPKSDHWDVKFSDNVSTVFAPKIRLYSNEKNKVVRAGYAAMLLISKEIAKVCLEKNISLVFTIIPTKELVYKKKVDNEKMNSPLEYKKLTNQETEYINWLASELEKIENAKYVDVVEALQDEALRSSALYPPDINGHPFVLGYEVMADQLSNNVELTWTLPEGLVALFTGEETYQLGLIRDGNYWSFVSTDIIQANGWDPSISPSTIYRRDIASLPNMGIISSVNKEEFGPR